MDSKLYDYDDTHDLILILILILIRVELAFFVLFLFWDCFIISYFSGHGGLLKRKGVVSFLVSVSDTALRGRSK